MTILIVDDNAGVRRLLRSAIDQLGANVWDCSDGSDALNCYERHHPDVVLMDLSMPVLDGISATRQILRSDPSAKVIIVTDYDDDDLRKAARQAGSSGYALKRNLLDLVPLILSTLG